MPAEYFAMEQSALARYLEDLDTIAVMIRENPTAFLDLDDIDDDDDIDAILNVDAQGMARISVSGVLTPNGPSPIAKLFGASGTSYKAIRGALDKAASNPMVKQASLDINSPGGNIDGMDETWQAVRNFPKPISAVNRGTMASAAYNLGSAVGPGKMFASSPFAVTGSIGVMAVYTDTSAIDEKYGIKKRAFVSKNAPLKNAGPDTEAGAKAIQQEIDAHERNFHARIAEGRGISAEMVAANYGKGGVYVAQDPDPSQPSALKAGMIDKIITGSAPMLTGPLAFAPKAQSQKPVTGDKPTPHRVGWQEKYTDPRAGTPEDSMNLTEFLASNPDAKAAYDQAITAARTEGEKSFQIKAEAVGKILASEAYQKNTVIQAKGVEVLAGQLSMETFQSIVGAVDATTEAMKIAAEANGPSLKETPAQAEAAAKKSSDELLAKATTLKIDVEVLKKNAERYKIPFEQALAAEVQNQELLAADKRAGAVA